MTNKHDCDNPICHEQMTKELGKKADWGKVDEIRNNVEKKVPKSWLWLGFVFIGLPVSVMAAGVWSGQTSDPLRYASKAQVSACELRIERLEEGGKYLRRDLDEIKSGLKELLKRTQIYDTKKGGLSWDGYK